MKRRGWITPSLTTALFLGLLAGCRHDKPTPAKHTEIPPPTPAMGLPLKTWPSTADPYEALMRMVLSYKSLDTAYQRLDSKIHYSFQPGADIHQSTTIVIRRQPAALAEFTKDPAGGTQCLIADGTNFWHYIGLTNVYKRRQLAGDLRTLAEGISNESPTVLSPVAFLCSADLPLGLANAKMMPSEQVLGHQAVVVMGDFDKVYLIDLGKSAAMFNVTFSSASGTYCLWLDPSNYRVLKSQFKLEWRGLKDVPKGLKTTNPVIEATTTYPESIPNPKLDPDTFRFYPPNKAVEIFGDILK